MYNLDDGHPLFTTHHVTLCGESDSLIPNVVGGALPRKDKGDYDFYCATMLVLFKPWRQPEDLKHPNQSWGEAYREFEFSKRQVQLMSNFNLRHECLDARDDFRYQMEKDANT
ncbi:hypothetical protein CYLTODRAFT_363454, partial [Cylindrobasidium torrendii FP15055 ss-10]